MKTRSLLLATLLPLLSCRDNRASLQIQMLCMPKGECVFSSKCDAQFIGLPTIDPAVTANMRVFLQVENTLGENSNDATGKLNTNNAHLDEAVIEYQGLALPKDVHVLPNFLVQSGATSVIGLDVIRNVGTNQSLLRTFGTSTLPGRDLVANIRLRGYLDDGSRFETGEYPMGIRVCTNCLAPDPCPGQLACPQIGIEPVACGTVL